MEKLFRTAGIAGLGLIGGSLAMALRERTDLTVHGYDRDPAALRAAAAAGAIHRADGPLSACDVLFVALYPGAAVDYVREHAGELRRGALVVDLCGVKRAVCAPLAALCDGPGLGYLGAHPMAGREVSGFAGALPGLFDGASLILTPCQAAGRAMVPPLSALMRKIGFGRIVETTPEHHDRMIAYTSQLAHVLSSAYIQNPLARDYSGFTGGSFQDLTRVSRLNAARWGELFDLNRDMLAEQLDALIGNLQAYRAALVSRDAAALGALMEKGTALKNELLARAALEEE